MSEGYDHLVPDAARMADASDAARFRFIERDKLVPTPSFSAATQHFEELFGHQRTIRPPNLAFVGPSGIGKSLTIDQFVARHRPRRHRTSGEWKVPVLHVEHPPLPGPGWYARTIAQGLGYTVALPRNHADMFEVILERIERAEVRLIITEEVNQIYGWPRAHIQEFYGVTRWLSNKSRVPQVVSGTDEVLEILDGDIQLVRRFERLQLSPFALDETFAGFLKAYLQTLPLRRPTALDRGLIERVYEAGEGITDTTVKVLQRAAKRAIMSKAEVIKLEDIQAADVGRRPDERRRRKPRRRTSR